MRRTWFITGASSGLGRELTAAALRRGDQVAATARNLRALDVLAAEYPERLWVRPLEVTDTADVRRVIAEAFAVHGRVDVVVNNAGYGLFGAAEEVSDAQIERQIATNLTAPMQIARAVLPHLRQQRSGHLVQVSSMAGQMVIPWLSIYCATKWGIEGFMDALAVEVEPFGISVTLVEPGTMRTEFLRGLDVPEAIDAYHGTPAGDIRRMVEAGDAPELGDPARMASAIIAATDMPRPPRRLALGSDSYDQMHAALTERLTVLKDQKKLAYAMNFDHSNTVHS